MSIAFNSPSTSQHPSSSSRVSCAQAEAEAPSLGTRPLPLSAFSSLPLTSSLSSTSTVPINSPPRAKPTITYLPTFEKPLFLLKRRGFEGHNYTNCDPISYYVCASCGTHLSQTDELVSKAFSGRDGKAYLFQTTINTVLGKHEERELLTGLHTVADLKCKMCSRSVGWAYIKAHENTQKYKEGKFIMERAALHKENNWDNWD